MRYGTDFGRGFGFREVPRHGCMWDVEEADFPAVWLSAI